MTCISYSLSKPFRRYGFPNQEAVDAGASGSKCRGEEHDVTLTWSVTSGKRIIMTNGKQIFSAMNKTNSFDHSWIDNRGNQIKMVAFASAPLSTVAR